jgi:hypothetical protein
MTRDNQSDDDSKTGSQSGKEPAQGSQQKGTSHRGFAAMDENKQRDIARAGGRAAHEKGTAHEFDSEEARIAGRKGGEAVSENREHMAEIGRKGGEARQAAANASRSENKSSTESSSKTSHDQTAKDDSELSSKGSHQGQKNR